MSEVKTPNDQTEDSVSQQIYSQNRQSVTNQINVAGNIIFGGYSPGRSTLPSLDQIEVLKHYLVNVIDGGQRLPLQGIRSSKELVRIELE